MARRMRLIGAFVGVALLAFWLGVISMALYVRSQPMPDVAHESTFISPPVLVVPTLTEPVSTTLFVPSATALLRPPATATAPPLPTRTLLPTFTTDQMTPTLVLLDLINAARADAECDVALTWEPRLAEAAQQHAVDMATHDFIDHTGSDGASYTTRLERVGYTYNRRGENIAAGFTEPQTVLDQWMDEPEDGPHRLNVLNCAYQHAGVGLAFRADGYPYWVLDLAEPKDE